MVQVEHVLRPGAGPYIERGDGALYRSPPWNRMTDTTENIAFPPSLAVKQF